MIAALLFLPVLLLTLATIDALIVRRRAREHDAQLARMRELCPWAPELRRERNTPIRNL